MAVQFQQELILKGQKMLPYHTFAEIVKEHPSQSFRDVWFEFEVWEQSRGYRDDPSAASKEALEWVRSLYELDVALDDFQEPGVTECHDAIESVFVAFARLNHKRELCEAVSQWKTSRED